MAEFNLQPRLDAEQSDPSDAEALLSTVVDTHEDVSLADQSVDAAGAEGVLVPERFLEIEGVEVLAAVYKELRENGDVVDVALWGPTAERFPVRVQHYALQQIGQPDLYEFHALDGQVTLVIAESQMEAEQLHREVPGGALG
jgi:hypothetical protein